MRLCWLGCAQTSSWLQQDLQQVRPICDHQVVAPATVGARRGRVVCPALSEQQALAPASGMHAVEVCQLVIHEVCQVQLLGYGA